MEKRNDEIDLFELMGKIFHPFKVLFMALFSMCIYILKLCLRNWYYIALFVMVGASAGFLKNNTKDDTFITKATMKVNTVAISDVVSQIKNLNSLIEENSFAVLAEQLKIKYEEAEQIDEIYANYVYDINKDGIPDVIDEEEQYLMLKDSNIVRFPDRLGVSMKLKSMTSLAKIEDGLLMSVNVNPFFLKVKKTERLQKENKIAVLDTEIKKLTKLQELRYKREDYKFDKDKYILQHNEKLYHDDIISLFDQKQKLEKDLVLSKEIAEYSKHFSRYTNPKNLLFKYVINYGIMGFIISFLLLLFIDNRKLIRDFVNS